MKKRYHFVMLFIGMLALVFFLAVILASCGSDGAGSGTAGTTPVGVSLVMPVTASLTGAQEIPPVATAGTGSAVLSVNFATGALSGTVSFAGLSSAAVAAHIHEGAAGVNGLIIIPLTGGIGLTNGIWTVLADTVLTAAQLAELQAGGLYVQIHTVMFPAGEIRGQLVIP
jgi:CHRD domain-containing protein